MNRLLVSLGLMAAAAWAIGIGSAYVERTAQRAVSTMAQERAMRIHLAKTGCADGPIEACGGTGELSCARLSVLVRQCKGE